MTAKKPIGLREFERLRAANLETLRSWHLSAAQLDLPGEHPSLERVTLRESLQIQGAGQTVNSRSQRLTMRTHNRYKLDRVLVTPLQSRPASWTFAGSPVRGTELAYAVTDTNLAARNRWEFMVRVPRDRNGRVEVRPRTTPRLKAWAELPDRSVTFSRATKASARGKWYCQVALADVTGKRSRVVVNTAERQDLPHWFTELAGRMRRKEAVKHTRGTDGNSLVVLTAPDDHVAMIRLYFATKVWILSEGITLSDG